MAASTILAIRSEQARMALMACDGQATMDSRVVKTGARKIHRLYNGQVLAGFTGATADGIALLERLEDKLRQKRSLREAALELSKEWRTDRVLRQLEAVVVALSPEALLVLTGEGDVVEPDDGLVGIGSGGGYALSAARALLRHTNLPLPEVAREALRIAAEIDIYTNEVITVESLVW